MKRDPDSILNAELSHAVADAGHTDRLMVVDAGFPIPADAWRIDLALTRGVPEVSTVLEAIHDELIPERVLYAEDVPEMNPDFDAILRDLYDGSGAELDTVPHEAILEYIDNEDVDLTVMGSKTRSGDYRRMLGSVTERVSRQSTAPVSIVKTNVPESVTSD